MAQKTKANSENYSEKKSSVPFFALLLITVGIIFLLNNFGVVPWTVWYVLAKFWPIFLILTGLELFLSKSVIGTAIITAFTVLILFTISLISISVANPAFGDRLAQRFPQFEIFEKVRPLGYFQPRPVFDEQAINKSVGDVEDTSVEISLGAGRLTLRDEVSDNYLRLVSSRFNGNAPGTFDYEVDDKTLEVEIRESFSGPNWGMHTQESGFELFVDNQTAVSFEVEIGAGSFVSFIEEAPVKSYLLNVGAGKAVVRFNENTLPTEKVSIDVGAGNVEIYLPKSASLDLDYKVGLGELVLNGEKVRGAGEHRDTGYETSSERVSFNINIGAGKVSIVKE